MADTNQPIEEWIVPRGHGRTAGRVVVADPASMARFLDLGIADSLLADEESLRHGQRDEGG
jgi:hypothetical protein